MKRKETFERRVERLKEEDRKERKKEITRTIWMMITIAVIGMLTSILIEYLKM